MKKISILGSTGSIGTQALDIIKENGNYEIVGLTANKNIDLLEKQALEYKPEVVAVADKEKARILDKRLKTHGIRVLGGIEGLVSVATLSTADIILNSVVGMVGLVPTVEAIKAKKIIALANKETLVTGGEIITRLAKDNGVDILPVDSEHSAIFQCLQSGKVEEVSKIILTASGGPFRGKNKEELKNVTLRDALNHPNWSMGKKISVDSATLMNKGLEVIEAKWLFDMGSEKIDVVVHPQSIVHSMVEYVDGSVIAQLGIHDMRIPIQYALNYPKRQSNSLTKLNLAQIGKLTFEEPDVKTFSALSLAIQAMDEGGTMTTVLNGANEAAVNLFLQEKIGFMKITETVEKVMTLHKNIKNPTLEDILEVDKWSRKMVIEQLNL